MTSTGAQPAAAIHNRVRGLQPWPGAHTRFRGQLLHIWRARDRRRRTGHRVRPAPGRRWWRCGDGRMLELLEVQLEGRKRMPAAAFANGQRLTENEILGEIADLNLPLGYRYSATYAGIRAQPNATIWR